MRRNMVAALLVLFLAFISGCISHQTSPVNSCVLVLNQRGHGSGVVIDSNSVLTARHVSDRDDLRIQLNSGKEYKVVRIQKSNNDAARLFIQERFLVRGLPIDRSVLRVGDSVLVIGTPAGKEALNCQLPGRVVKVDADIDYGYSRNNNFDLVDAHGGPGCSGGPVLRDGKVVGLLVGGGTGLGISLPVQEFKDVLR